MSPTTTSVLDDLERPSAPERVTGTTSPGSGRFYRPELDVLRFAAFLFVFLYHVMPATALPPAKYSGLKSLAKFTVAGLKNSAPFGMCLFFILSSYLITELLQREKLRTGTIHIPSFYMRRILRIWPLYFAFVLAMAALGHFVPIYMIESGRFLSLFLLAGNWYVAKYGFGAYTIVPLWSISVEEQFYLIWPSLARIGGNVGLMILSAVIFPMSWIAIYHLAATHASPDAVWVNTFVQFQFFAVGALLAVYMKGRIPKFSGLTRYALFAAGFAVWIAAEVSFQYQGDGRIPRPGNMVLGFTLAGIGCLFIFCSFLGSQAIGKMKSLVYLGKISYGLYIFHYLCIVISRAIVHALDSRIFSETALSPEGMIYKLQGVVIIMLAFALTVIFAALSYKYMEHPFLKLKERFTFIQSRKA